MQASDRDGFVKLVGQLCAGFEVPMSEARVDAYWRGLEQLALPAFERIVTFALGEDGPAKFPKVADIWQLHRSLRVRAPPPPMDSSVKPEVYDQWDIYANGKFFEYIRKHVHLRPQRYGGADQRIVAVRIAPLLAAKRAWCEDQRAFPERTAELMASDWYAQMAAAERRVDELVAAGVASAPASPAVSPEPS